MGLDSERRKLLAAYYADAIDLPLLRQEQTRISQRTSTLETRRRALTTNLDQWQAVLETAGRFATNCAATYRHADPRTASCPVAPALPLHNALPRIGAVQHAQVIKATRCIPCVVKWLLADLHHLGQCWTGATTILVAWPSAAGRPKWRSSPPAPRRGGGSRCGR